MLQSSIWKTIHSSFSSIYLPFCLYFCFCFFFFAFSSFWKRQFCSLSRPKRKHRNIAHWNTCTHQMHAEHYMAVINFVYDFKAIVAPFILKSRCPVSDHRISCNDLQYYLRFSVHFFCAQWVSFKCIGPTPSECIGHINTIAVMRRLAHTSCVQRLSRKLWIIVFLLDLLQLLWPKKKWRESTYKFIALNWLVIDVSLTMWLLWKESKKSEGAAVLAVPSWYAKQSAVYKHSLMEINICKWMAIESIIVLCQSDLSRLAH